MPPRLSLGQRIKNWYSEQVTQYKIQKAFGERNRSSTAIIRKQDRDFAEIDKKGLDPFDTVMAKYDYRRKEQEKENNPAMDAILNASGDLWKNMSDLESDEKKNRILKEPGGWGLGAFFGRLMYGRLTSAGRKSGDADFQRFSNETGISSKEEREIKKLKTSEPLYRAGMIKAENILSDKAPNPEFKDAKNYMENNADKRAVIQETLCDTAKNVIGLEAVNNDLNAIFKKLPNSDFSKAKTGLKTLEAPFRRLSLARGYMLANGMSVDQIFSQEPADMEKKGKLGKDFTDLLHCGDPGRIGNEFAKIAKCLNEQPVPNVDLMKDNDLVKMYRQWSLISQSLQDLDQSMPQSGSPTDTKTYEEFLKSFAGPSNGKDVGEKNFSGMMDRNNAIKAAGLTDRFKFILSPGYSVYSAERLENEFGIKEPDDKKQSMKNTQEALTQQCMYRETLAKLNKEFKSCKGKPFSVLELNPVEYTKASLEALDNFKELPSSAQATNIYKAMCSEPEPVKSGGDKTIEQIKDSDVMNDYKKKQGIVDKPEKKVGTKESEEKIEPKVKEGRNLH